MPVPDYQTFMRPILELGVNGEISIRTCIERIAEQFQLSEEDRREPVPSGRQSKLDNRVSWARIYLAKAGAVRVTRRAHFKTTERGRTLLTRYSGPIGTKILRQFPEFLDFQKSKNTPVSGEGAASDGNAAA
ncbi:MAG: winged helix-turn-helix domain-containing protein, partial [Thalassobaculaceae bacterium]